jgi:hypothetical protein
MAAEILKRYFHGEIQELLFPTHGWLSRSINDNAFVNNDSVQLPHAGTLPAVVVNRVILPATISKRTDIPTEYKLEELTTDPTLLQDSEALVVAYDKRASILKQQAQLINKKGADRALVKWAAGANEAGTFATTGAARPAGNSNGGQTGNRKAMTEADLVTIQGKFFADDVVTELEDVQGIAIITPRMYADLITLDNFKRADAYGVSNIPSGVVRRAYGFDFYVRSSVIVADNANAIVAEGSVPAATHQDAALFYSPSFVRKALGERKTYLNADLAEYYGSIFSMMVRFGASPARNDGKGIYLIYEDNV